MKSSKDLQETKGAWQTGRVQLQVEASEVRQVVHKMFGVQSGVADTTLIAVHRKILEHVYSITGNHDDGHVSNLRCNSA